MSRFAVLALFALPVLAFAANPGSDTVATSSLVAGYMVAQASGANTVGVGVVLASVGAVNGVLQETALDISSDETVTFSNGTNTMTFDPADTNNDNVLPAVSGATYSATYTRSNGEQHATTMTIPALAQYTSPAAGATIDPSQNVDIVWTAAAADETYAMVSANCQDLLNALVWDPNGTAAHIAAGSATKCTGTTQVQVDVVSIKNGSGFGAATGSSDATLLFSYTGSSTGMAPSRLSAQDLIKFVQQARLAGVKHLTVKR